MHAIHLALAYRARFHRDAFVDLVCYRKHGHNEMDDPTFTQPVMYRKIKSHVQASRAYADRLVDEGVLDIARLEAIESDIAATLREAHQRARTKPVRPKQEMELGGSWKGLGWASSDWTADTSVHMASLERIVEATTMRSRLAMWALRIGSPGPRRTIQVLSVHFLLFGAHGFGACALVCLTQRGRDVALDGFEPGDVEYTCVNEPIRIGARTPARD